MSKILRWDERLNALPNTQYPSSADKYHCMEIEIAELRARLDAAQPASAEPVAWWNKGLGGFWLSLKSVPENQRSMVTELFEHTPAQADSPFAGLQEEALRRELKDQSIHPAYKKWLTDRAQFGVEAHGGNEIWNAAWKAAQADAQDARWISVKDRFPECDMTPNSFGVQVLVYPPYKSEGEADMNCAFYGCRQTDEPNFYMFGRVFYPTHWSPLPPPPAMESK